VAPIPADQAEHGPRLPVSSDPPSETLVEGFERDATPCPQLRAFSFTRCG
jgi:hypothetical protein